MVIKLASDILMNPLLHNISEGLTSLCIWVCPQHPMVKSWRSLTRSKFSETTRGKVSVSYHASQIFVLCSASEHSTSHHITSHHITEHHITSHHITSHHITEQHITSHHITSHHSTALHITSHHSTAHHITSQHRAPQHSTAQHHAKQHTHCITVTWL